MSTTRPIRLALALALAGLAVATAAADEAVLSPAADGTLFEPITPGVQTSSGAGQTLYCGKTNSAKRRRALVRFDLSSIPPGSTITSVSLQMVLDRAVGGARNVGLYVCSRPWGEGTSDSGDAGGRGATPTAGDVTWIHSVFPGTMWTAAGGDFVSTVHATASADATGQTVTWASTPQLVADVQAWLDGTSANNGWLLHHVDESPSRTAKQFCSRENATVANRPRLVVDYTPPGPVCIADFNNDGIVNSTDVSDFINQWFQDLVDGTFLTDWDHNGVVNSTDVSNFINDWFASPPECLL
jgi:hypothetical protein